MTAPKVKAASAVLMGLLLAGVIGAGTSMPAAAAPTEATLLRLDAKPQAERFALGKSVRVDLTVTNNSAAECGLVDLSAATVEVVDASRDGKPLAPSFVHSLLANGASTLLAEHLKPIPAKGSLAVPLESSPLQTIEVMTPLRDGSALTALWPVDAQGRYEFHLRYHVPPPAGGTACASASNVVLVKFAVGDSSRQSWWLVGAIGAVVLVLLVVALFLLRRRRGRAAAKAAAVILAVIGVVTALTGRPAQAFINIHDPGGSPQLTTFWGNCMKAITSLDPSIDTILNAGSEPKVDIYFWTFTERHDVKGKPHDSTIFWDPFPGGFLEPGVAYDPCAELYHELIHAQDAATDSLSGQYCDDTGVQVDEVRATIAENKYRQAQIPPLPIRTTYDGKKIPLTSVDDCFRNPRQASTGPDSRCRAVNGACHNGHSSGDPHLFTLDGAYYDLQAVGEFVALRADDAEVQVRQAPFTDSRIVSVNSAVAVKVAGKRIGIYQTAQGVSVDIDGQPANVLLGETDLGGGALLISENDFLGTRYSVMWPDTMIITVQPIGHWMLQLDVSVPSGRKVAGLFGDFDGNLANDRPEDLYGAFAEKWRVTDATSLFDYATGESTATFTDKSFPDKTATPPASEAAKEACRLMGLPAGPIFDACVLDVSVTGQANFAVTAGEIATPPLRDVELKGNHAVLTVDTPGGSAKTTIHGDAGQRLYVLVTSTNLPDGCSPLHLFDPKGTELTSGCLNHGTGELDGPLLPVTGDYSVVLTPVQNAVGSVSLRLYLSTDEKQTAIPDKDFVATIATPGAVSRLEFTATAGQRIFVDMPSYALPSGCGDVSLVGATSHFNYAVGCAGDGVGILDTYTIQTAGAYAIEVNPPRDALGQIRLRLSFITDVTGTISPTGPEIVTTLTQPGSRAAYTFSGIAGQKVTLDISGSTFPEGCGVFEIAESTNFVLTLGCTSNGAGHIDPFTLPASGTYKVLVDPPDRRVGTAHIRLKTA